MRSSRIPQFYKKTYQERLAILKDDFGLTDEDLLVLRSSDDMQLQVADRMVENVIATLALPLGLATNFLINNVDYLVPMSVEESSVIAAACHAAKLARPAGGFTVTATHPIMVGQIQLVDVIDSKAAQQVINNELVMLLAIANSQDEVLIAKGGGALAIEFKDLVTPRGPMLIVCLVVNVCNAMGSNIVNTMVEKIAPHIELITGLKARLKIVSNGASRRIVKARAVWQRSLIGDDIIEGILDADAFAHADPSRAATHNKGIMNGIDAVALATGNDFRAIEAAAHSYAVRDGEYRPLSRYYCDDVGDLVGELEIPLAVGIVGGITKTHPMVCIALKILGVDSASSLAQVMAAVGLAQNFAALRVLVSEGIQKGHMRLHSKNMASNVGARNEEITLIAEQMICEQNISVKRAEELLERLQKGSLCL